MRGIPNNVAVLLDSLRFRAARPETLRTLNDAEWRDLLSFSDHAHLTLFLSELNHEFLPEWVERRIAENVSDNAKRFEHIQQAYAEIAAALKSARIEHVVLKGFAQYPGFVPSPRLRAQSDIDLFCPQESVIGARDALTALGYETDHTFELYPSDHLPALVRNREWKWRGNAFDPQMPPSVELHFFLWNEAFMRFPAKGVDQFWERRVMRQVEGLIFPGLNSADNLGYSALQVLRDLLRSDWILHRVYEVARFLHVNARNAGLWKAWKEQHDDSLRSLEAISFSLAMSWFSCDVSEEVKAEVLGMPAPVQQWLRSFSAAPLKRMFRPNKDEVWLYLSLVESAGHRAAVLRNTLLPWRIPELNRPGQDETKFGQVGKFQLSQQHARYLLFVVSRTSHHARALLSVCGSGIRLWISGKRLGRPFWTFFAASFFFDFGFSIFFFLFNFYLLGHGFNEKSIGLLSSAMALGGIASTIPAGLLIERIGLRRALLVCCVTAVLVSFLRALAVSQLLQLVLSFFAGAALAVWAICLGPALAALTSEHNRPFAFSLVFSDGIGLGALGALVGGSLPGSLNWAKSLPGMGDTNRIALLIACAIVALGIWPISRIAFTDAPAPSKRRYFSNPFLLRFLPAVALWSFVANTFLPFANVYFARLRMPVPRIGAVFSIAHILQVVAVLLSPLMFRRVGLVPGMIFTQIAIAGALCCLASVRGVTAAALVYIGYTALQWMCEPGIYSLLMNGVPAEERSGASALANLVMSSAQVAAAALAGISLIRFGYPAVLWATAAAALAAAGLFGLLPRKLAPAHRSSA